MEETQIIAAISSPAPEMTTIFSISDIIQICGIIVALLVGVVSIIISIRTIRQNAEIIKETNKAQIHIFPYDIYGDDIPRIRIQNFGQSVGQICEINAPEEAMAILGKFSRCLLAPGQSITTVFIDLNTGIAKPLIKEFDIHIKYQTLGEIIDETQHINYEFLNGAFQTIKREKDIAKILNNIHQSIQGLQQK